MGGIYATVSLGLNVVFGVLRVINFAHGEFVMVGMYLTYLLSTRAGLDPYVAAVVAACALYVLGTLLYRSVFERLMGQPLMQTLASFGLLVILQNTALAASRGQFLSMDTSYSRVSLTVGSASLSLPSVIGLAVGVSATLLLAGLLTYTRTGRAMRAVAQDRAAAALMGIDVHRISRLTFGLGSACAGLAGGVLAPAYVVKPAVGGDFILAAFAVVVLGGLGSAPGTLVGGFLVGLVETLAGYYLSSALKEAVWFLVFLLVLLVRPAGFFGRAGSEEVGFK